MSGGGDGFYLDEQDEQDEWDGQDFGGGWDEIATSLAPRNDRWGISPSPIKGEGEGAAGQPHF